MKRVRNACLSFAALCAAALLYAGCGDRGATQPQPYGPAAVVVSGDTAGWIVPCGCTANQSGGLQRRGTFLKNLRAGGGHGANGGQTRDVLYVDAGGAAGGTSAYHATKFRAILKGEMLMGLVAHNLGKSEIAMGPARLREISSELKAPFVSANIRPLDGSIVPAEPVRFATAGGRRYAIVGVCSPSFATKEIAIDDPASAVAKTVADVKGQFDALVVLAYMPQDELDQLAATVPEADAVIGGPTGQALVPRPVGQVLVGAATNKGKFLVRLDHDHTAHGQQASTGWKGTVDEMGPSIADEEAQLANLQAYLAELEKLDYIASETGLVTPPPAHAPADYRIAGSTACISCHAAEHAQWASSKHAHAWETLVDHKYHVDSYCQSCHTTGFGQPGGFENRAKSEATLTAVGCESCHGPSQAHVSQPSVRTTFNAFDQCISCHDQENSPKFDLKDYWSRIQHGKKIEAVR